MGAHQHRSAWLGLLIVSGCLTGCGARTGLFEPHDDPDGGGNGGSDASSLPDAGEPPVEPSSCRLELAGDPIPVITFPDRHAGSSSLAVLHPGDGSRPARIAVQTMASGGSSAAHSDVQVAMIRVGSAWPDATVVEHAPVLVGVETHSWGEMTKRPTKSGKLAFAWNGDPGGFVRPMFRTLDVDSWSAGKIYDLAPDGNAAMSIALGAGTGPAGVGYQGEGIAVAWRQKYEVGPEPLYAPVVAIIEPNAEVMLGPHPVAGQNEYPGRAPRITWSTSAYVMATGFRDCPENDDLCEPNATVFSHIRTASSAAQDDSGIERVGTIPALRSGWAPYRPDVSAHGGRVYAAWRERSVEQAELPAILRVVELDATGRPTGLEAPIAENIEAEMESTVTTSALGVVVTTAQFGDKDLAPEVPGRSRLVIRRYDFDLQPLDEVTVPATRLDTYGWPWSVVIDNPKSVLVTYSGARQDPEGGPAQVYLGRIDCIEVP